MGEQKRSKIATITIVRPFHGTFISSLVEMMRLHKQMIPQLKNFINTPDWSVDDIDHAVFHQPSETAFRKVITRIGVDLEQGVYAHHSYGNSASATIGVLCDHLLKERELQRGYKILFGSAAGGFTMVTLAGERSMV